MLMNNVTGHYAVIYLDRSSICVYRYQTMIMRLYIIHLPLLLKFNSVKSSLCIPKNLFWYSKLSKGVALVTALSVQLCSNGTLCGSRDQFHDDDNSTTHPTSEPNLTENPSVSPSVKPTSSLPSSTLPTSTTTTTEFFVDPNCP